jgi:hypothetical protein
MDPGLKDIIDLIGSVGAPAVTVLLAMKYAINGMRADVAEIKESVTAIKAKQDIHAIQLAVLQDRNERVDPKE